MKRIAAIAVLIILSTLGLGAAVWDGSAVSGVAGDFPDDGFYGACNSFPRDTSVTVTNLENGKTVTVTITRNVDNPGVFIALSPKAAAELGMRAGSSARIRATALTASQAETSLPPARAGETADPDFNPKVYVEREKAAVAAAAAAAPAPIAAPAQAAAPAAAAAAAPQPPAVAATPAAPQPPAVAATPAAAPVEPAAPEPAVAPAQIAAAAPAVPATPTAPSPEATPTTAAAPESAEILAKTSEPKKQTTPAPAELSEPKPAAAAVAAAPKAVPSPAAPAKSAAKVPADALALPEASPVFPGSPRPSPYGVSLPTPDVPTLPAPASPIARSGYLAQAPEIVGDSKPAPRKAALPRLAMADPALPSAAGAAAAPGKAQGKAPERAAVEALARPTTSSPGSENIALAEPKAEFGPDELPEAVLSRVTAPARLVPEPVLAEAKAPEQALDANGGPEAIGWDKPSYAEAVEAAALDEGIPLSPDEAYSADRPGKAEGESTLAELAEAAPPGSPEALAYRKALAESGAMAELQVPDLPSPIEGLANERPVRGKSEALAAELTEPGVSSPSSTGMGPTVVADARKGPSGPPPASLADPAVPTPESYVAGSPNAAASGQIVAELAEPSPTRPSAPDTATAVAVEKPAPAAVPAAAELLTPAVPSPSESIASQLKSPPAPAERIVTLEPAAPRPPAAAVAAAQPSAPAPIETTPPAAKKPEAPAAVATIKGPSPAGAAQAPASIPMLSGLAKGSYYIQIGVYGTNDSLQAAIKGIKSAYPLAVEKLTTKAGVAAYRLFVGPLSRDESGVVLIRIRALGFKDAYVRQGT
jgi:hypothetical protein